MNVGSSKSGTIITFYSYKGGTGRSMAVANFACHLGKLVSNSSQRILVLDWDLEAPGLHSFFAARSEQPENKSRPGVINYFYDLHSLLSDGKDCYKDLTAEEGWKTLDKHLPLDDYVISDIVGGVDFIKAGRLDSQYGELVGSFDWVEFYNRYGSAIDAFRELLASKYAYCLIDSRTGLTDISGICTMLLPEKLVAVFTPNRQSLYGLLDLVSRAIEYRRASDDMRPLTVFPLPSRIDYAEHDLRQEWREEYQSSFEDLFRQLYEVDECNLSEYFNEVQLPHVSYYAYGEKIATLEERSEALSLRRAYEVFFQRLIELDSAWETPEKVEIVVREPLVEKELPPPKSRISIGLEPP
jgi:MinD-like ATPase involved in chromosome partitioning or flagellar assembly